MTTEVLTLTELSTRVDVDVDHLQRLIRTGSLPEATKQPRPDGPVWVVPTDLVDELVSRHGWTLRALDLTEGRELVAVEEPPAQAAPPAYARSDEEIAVAEVIDGVLLDRLLGAQEDRAEAEARARESQRAMTAMAAGQQRLVRELSEERYERQRSHDRLRDERSARMVTDAKLAELRARLDREQTMAEQEREARVAATRRSIQAEQEAALAMASMGWLARRRYQRRVDQVHRSIDGPQPSSQA